MSTYHRLVCPALGEGLSPASIGDNLNLKEICFGANYGTVAALTMLAGPQGRWHNQVVVLVDENATSEDLPERLAGRDPTDLYTATETVALRNHIENACTARFGVGLLYPRALGNPNRYGTSLVAHATARDDEPSHGAMYVYCEDDNSYLDPASFGAGRNLGALALRRGGPISALLLAVKVGWKNTSHDAFTGSWAGMAVSVGHLDRARRQGMLDKSELAKRALRYHSASDDEIIDSWTPLHHVPPGWQCSPALLEAEQLYVWDPQAGPETLHTAAVDSRQRILETLATRSDLTASVVDLMLANGRMSPAAFAALSANPAVPDRHRVAAALQI